MQTIYLLTKNKGKIAAANSIFSEYNISVDSIEKEYPEIQADSSLEIARHSAIQAAIEQQKIVVREDHSLFVNCLAAPGPYMAYFEKQVSAEKLVSIMEKMEDFSGSFVLGAAVAFPDGSFKEFEYKVPVHFKKEEVVKDPRGGWNGIICLEGEIRAFTEYPESERVNVWNKNYIEIAKYLKEKYA